jgi:hypothetical protein
MALSRRVFLTLVGFLPLAAWRAEAHPGIAAAGPPQPEKEAAGLVVVDGWVLRRDDLSRLNGFPAIDTGRALR